MKRVYARGCQAEKDARELAERASARIKANFPGWKVCRRCFLWIAGLGNGVKSRSVETRSRSSSARTDERLLAVSCSAVSRNAC